MSIVGGPTTQSGIFYQNTIAASYGRMGCFIGCQAIIEAVKEPITPLVRVDQAKTLLKTYKMMQDIDSWWSN